VAVGEAPADAPDLEDWALPSDTEDDAEILLVEEEDPREYVSNGVTYFPPFCSRTSCSFWSPCVKCVSRASTAAIRCDLPDELAPLSPSAFAYWTMLPIITNRGLLCVEVRQRVSGRAFCRWFTEMIFPPTKKIPLADDDTVAAVPATGLYVV
jgi:hypothetical protein